MNPDQEIAQLREQVRLLEQALAETLAVVDELRRQVANLQAQLQQDSHNSHLPPSRDLGRRGKRQSKSLRTKSDKPAGGQAGHSGRTLKLQLTPDSLTVHGPTHCQGCGAPLAPAAQALPTPLPTPLLPERRQLFDLPPVRLLCHEHRLATCLCPHCGVTSQGVFPPTLSQPVQYGPQLRALCVTLHHAQLLPLKRLSGLLGDWLGAAVAPASILTWVQQAAHSVAGEVERIKQALRQAPVLHCDETGHDVAGRRIWLHVAATQHMTCYQVHARRGQAGCDAMGVLPAYTGVVVHDGWSAYRGYSACRHALCNVHHLRELTFVVEVYKQPWAQALLELLLGAKAEVAAACAQGSAGLPAARCAALVQQYRSLLDAALLANPPPDPSSRRPGQRGRIKQGKVRNLIERLRTQEQAVLAFMHDATIPFDNNLAERDIRMVKVQQKIAGCYRSLQGAEAAAALRSYLSTLAKQGTSALHALSALFAGNLIPVAMPE